MSNLNHAGVAQSIEKDMSVRLILQAMYMMDKCKINIV